MIFSSILTRKAQYQQYDASLLDAFLADGMNEDEYTGVHDRNVLTSQEISVVGWEMEKR